MEVKMDGDIQHSIIRAMTPEAKLALSIRLYYSARELKASWIRQQHQDWTEQQVQLAVKKAFLNARS